MEKKEEKKISGRSIWKRFRLRITYNIWERPKYGKRLGVGRNNI